MSKHRKPTPDDWGMKIVLFAEVARDCGEETARRLFKKNGKPLSAKERRDLNLLLLFYSMTRPQKLTLAKQVNPDNPEKVLAQLKRALKDRRYAQLNDFMAFVSGRHPGSPFVKFAGTHLLEKLS